MCGAAARCTVTDPDLVCIPRELVEQARATAPNKIEVYDRRGEPAMSLGGYNVYFGNGSAVTSVYDVDTGEHRSTVLSDGVDAVREHRRAMLAGVHVVDAGHGRAVAEVHVVAAQRHRRLAPAIVDLDLVRGRRPRLLHELARDAHQVGVGDRAAGGGPAHDRGL